MAAVVAAMVAVAAIPTMAQEAPKAIAGKEGNAEAVVDLEVKAKAEKGKAEAVAGGAKAKAGCPDVPPEAVAGDVVAKAECPAPKKEEKKKEEIKKEEAPPPPPKAPPSKEEKKELPKAGGVLLVSLDGVSLLVLGAATLLVGSGLLVRRIIR